MSWYFPVFLSVPVSLDFCHVFPYELSNRTHSFNLLFLTLGEFQAWDWLWYSLTCGTRSGVGVRE